MGSIKNRMAELEEKFIAIRRQIHQNPETAFQELATTELVENELKSYGIQIFKNGNKTGVIGVLQGALPGKTIALRADMDALPLNEQTDLPYASKNAGKCHACGHDIHTSALLACACLLSERRDYISGTVKFIFQPAEEGQAGAKSIIANGFLDDVDAIFGAHTWPEMPGGSIGIRRGAMMASSDVITITVKAKGGHAAHPHKTSDPIVVAAYIITQLQTLISRELNPTDSAVVTIGKMTAGTANNIIPSEVVLEGTMRCISPETRIHLRKSIERIAKLTAQALGATAEVSIVATGYPVISDDSLVNLVEKSAIALLGEDNLLTVPTASMGSEDFAYYLEKKPGAFFRLGTQTDSEESRLALHNSKLIFSEKAITSGALTMCGIVFLYTGSDFNKLL